VIHTKLRSAFLSALALWLIAATIVAISSNRWVMLAAIPAGLMMLATAYTERLSQSAQLVWPVLLLPGASFAFIGLLQTLGYGRAVGEPIADFVLARNVFFGFGLLLHLAAFALLATESRASDHPGGEVADRMP
jgi:di/tricarboxylate transporter